MHHPVLLQSVLDHLKVNKDRRYIDATLGEGGYTKEILKLGGKVLGIDLDENQIYRVTQDLEERIKKGKLKIVQGNFGDIERIAKTNNFYPVDAVIFDLGLSMRQLHESGRGFSYKKENEPLDMRMDSKTDVTAADIINSRNEQDLYELFVKNSEELNSGSIARAIVCGRSVKSIRTVGELADIISKETGERDLPVLGRIFQALRIEVNDEFSQLEKGLSGALPILSEHGKILVVTFHSLEDRIVKMFARKKALSLIPKKPITSDRTHRYERSAKLRIIVK